MNKQMNHNDPELPSEAIAALTRGSKIDAIKSVRAAHALGLKEAKEIVERFIEMNPRLKTQMAVANWENARNAFRWLLLVAAVGLLACYFLAGTN
ncbi:MAG: ribosomal protein L7/L12 [Candidatus Accumulibacter sp.]|nr:ribosomal protein L7/L12 [Accumulibacter sp.]MCB1968087.1 ribosomal protein L7/L12 [Accumulibacter sp.]